MLMDELGNAWHECAGIVYTPAIHVRGGGLGVLVYSQIYCIRNLLEQL